MSKGPEGSSGVNVEVLASQFLRQAEPLGLTPELLQRLMESPQRMSEFVVLAKQAEADHLDRIRRLELERECAVDIDGVHYHLVLITPFYLANWGCKMDGLISDAVKIVRRHNYEPLREEAYPTVHKILETFPSSGQWIGWTTCGGLACWERTENGVEPKGSYGEVAGMSLSRFSDLCGMVFMQQFIGCDFNPANLT